MDHPIVSGGRKVGRALGFALCAILGAAALYLIVEDRGQATAWLPYLLLLACPLMHVFMHRNRGGHGRERRDCCAAVEAAQRALHANATSRDTRPGAAEAGAAGDSRRP